jgi:SAM-dependent methyltransferase
MDTTSDQLERSLFQKSYLLKLRMRQIDHAVSPMTERTALCIGVVPGAMRAQLLALGGDWTFSQDQHGNLPFKDGCFDRVLILDHLEWVHDDYAFMAEVHRVLKTAGLLFVDTEHRKRWSFWRPVRRLFGVDERPAERIRDGYTESTLFDILKDGFDLQEARTYSRFFVEGAESLLRMAVGAFSGGERSDGADQEGQADGAAVIRRIGHIQAVAYPFFLICAKLDWLLFFTGGYRIRVLARRRLWKPRRTPVLRDGRTLADATLNTRIGTANPF